MNKQLIEERMKQASTTRVTGFGETDTLDPVKFAELIVKECAGIYDKIDNGNLHMGTDNYLEALQKHFGVEE